MESRFWKKVLKTASCWLWTGTKNEKGYGSLKRNGKHIRSHRFSFELHNKCRIPEGKIIMHLCDNPSCVNPAHLRCATIKQNNVDMMKKGRWHRRAPAWNKGLSTLAVS